MLKTITKFVVERRRLVRQRRQQVLEEGESGDPEGQAEVPQREGDNSDPSGHSEIPQREGDNGDPSRHSEVPQREGDNSDSSRHSKVPPQLAEPQLGEPAAPTVWGKLKWYNRVKRYGFVELSDGSGDAFLHASALAGISVEALQPGVTIEFRTAPARRIRRFTSSMCTSRLGTTGKDCLYLWTLSASRAAAYPIPIGSASARTCRNGSTG